MNASRWVMDTNVLFEGLTQKGGAPGLLIDAWVAGAVQVCISNALAYEYVDVLSHKLSAPRWNKFKPVLGALFDQALFTVIYFSWRPTSPDPSDDHVIDCAMNANTQIITSNTRDFQSAQESLGLRVFTPIEAIANLNIGESQ